MAKNLWLLRTNAQRSSLLKHTLAVNVVDVHTQFTASLNFAVFASKKWHTKVKSPGAHAILVILRYQRACKQPSDRRLHEETVVSRKALALFNSSIGFSWLARWTRAAAVAKSIFLVWQSCIKLPTARVTPQSLTTASEIVKLLVRGENKTVMTDPIADFLTRIRNANQAKHESD